MRQLTYRTGGNIEQLLQFGPDDALQRILIVPPFFDEMNRVRHMLVEAMRALADADIASALPDLPGCNESLAKLEEQSLSGWRTALADAAEAFAATHVFSLRGGALIDDEPQLPVMRMASVKGRSLLNMLVRTRIAGDREAGVTTSGDDLAELSKAGPVELAGNNIGPALWADLETAAPIRMQEIQPEISPADVSGSALWLRAEPEHDPEMAAGLAKALASWSQAA